MDTLLIAHPSEDLCDALVQALSGEYRVVLCQDGQETLGLLRRQSFDAMILALELPNLDGLSILHKAAGHLPSAILGLTMAAGSYTFQQAAQLGCAHVLLTPCSVEAITRHLSRIRDHLRRPDSQNLSPQNRTMRHLQILNIPDHRPGFRQLQVAVPLYAQDPEQSLGKELYPASAKLCGKDNADQVSKSIERAIKEGWEARDDQIWREYFPRKQTSPPKCPTNQVFISNLARKLIQEMEEDKY